MRLVAERTVFANGSFPRSKLWERAERDVRKGIERVVWPPTTKTGLFKLRPGKHINGVKPVGAACIAYLRARGWRTETLPDLLRPVLTKKDLDAVLVERNSTVALEWETGNISSSHRAINKLLIGFHRAALKGAILVVASEDLARHLTDRVGNLPELKPYIEFWKESPVRNGVFRVFVVEHDVLDRGTRPIPKGRDGMHLAARIRKTGP